MKINWGWKIALLYSGFVAMMLVLVGMSVSQKIDLVSDDYYAMELAHQQKIDKIKRSNALEQRVRLELHEEGFLEVTFPDTFRNRLVTGKIMLYCPADNRNDLVIPLKREATGTQKIQTESIQPGRYLLQVDWAANGVTYWSESVVNINK